MILLNAIFSYKTVFVILESRRGIRYTTGEEDYCFDGPFTFRVGLSRKEGRIRGCGSLNSNEKDGDIGHEAQVTTPHVLDICVCFAWMKESIHAYICFHTHLKVCFVPSPSGASA